MGWDPFYCNLSSEVLSFALRNISGEAVIVEKTAYKALLLGRVGKEIKETEMVS